MENMSKNPVQEAEREALDGNHREVWNLRKKARGERSKREVGVEVRVPARFGGGTMVLRSNQARPVKVARRKAEAFIRGSQEFKKAVRQREGDALFGDFLSEFIRASCLACLMRWIDGPIMQLEDGDVDTSALVGHDLRQALEVGPLAPIPLNDEEVPLSFDEDFFAWFTEEATDARRASVDTVAEVGEDSGPGRGAPSTRTE